MNYFAYWAQSWHSQRMFRGLENFPKRQLVNEEIVYAIFTEVLWLGQESGIDGSFLRYISSYSGVGTLKQVYHLPGE